MILIVCRLIVITSFIYQDMKQSINDTFVLGKVLRSFREKMRISQEKLAEMASLHRTYIGSVERGERNPSFKSLGRVLQSMGISWSHFGKHLDSELMRKRDELQTGKKDGDRI